MQLRFPTYGHPGHCRHGCRFGVQHCVGRSDYLRLIMQAKFHSLVQWIVDWCPTTDMHLATIKKPTYRCSFGGVSCLYEGEMRGREARCLRLAFHLIADETLARRR